MKTKLISIFICILLISCEKDKNVNSNIREGFELYLTEKPYENDLHADYSNINFDTIALIENPILQYHDIKIYDTITHIISLNISNDSLNFGAIGTISVRGRMFVATLDKKPIYCGFYWPLYSSLPCNWVFIEEPYPELDNLKNNEIKISFMSTVLKDPSKDPRLDKRIVDRLKEDGKIK